MNQTHINVLSLSLRSHLSLLLKINHVYLYYSLNIVSANKSIFRFASPIKALSVIIKLMLPFYYNRRESTSFTREHRNKPFDLSPSRVLNVNYCNRSFRSLP